MLLLGTRSLFIYYLSDQIEELNVLPSNRSLLHFAKDVIMMFQGDIKDQLGTVSFETVYTIPKFCYSPVLIPLYSRNGLFNCWNPEWLRRKQIFNSPLWCSSHSFNAFQLALLLKDIKVWHQARAEFFTWR